MYLKVKSRPSRARTDIIEMIKAGFDIGAARSYLTIHGPALVDAFDEAVRVARPEEHA